MFIYNRLSYSQAGHRGSSPLRPLPSSHGRVPRRHLSTGPGVSLNLRYPPPPPWHFLSIRGPPRHRHKAASSLRQSNVWIKLAPGLSLGFMGGIPPRGLFRLFGQIAWIVGLRFDLRVRRNAVLGRYSSCQNLVVLEGQAESVQIPIESGALVEFAYRLFGRPSTTTSQAKFSEASFRIGQARRVYRSRSCLTAQNPQTEIGFPL